MEILSGLSEHLKSFPPGYLKSRLLMGGQKNFAKIANPPIKNVANNKIIGMI